MTRRKRYSVEFKREAIRRANEEGVTDVPMCWWLRNWVLMPGNCDAGEKQ